MQDAVGVLGLVIGIAAIFASIFQQDLRVFLMARFEFSRNSAANSGKYFSRDRTVLAALLIPFGIIGILGGAIIILRPPSRPAASGTNAITTAPAPGRPQRAAPATDSTSRSTWYDWTTEHRNIAAWYRLSPDGPPLLIDGAGIEAAGSIRRFWNVWIPRSYTGSWKNTAFVMSRMYADCDKRTLARGRTILYDNDGRTLSEIDEAEMQNHKKAKTHGILPGSNGSNIVSFVCEGPNADSEVVLTGSGLSNYLVPTFTRAPG